MDARQKGFTSADRWSNEKTFSNRVDFHIKEKKPAELKIDKIREDDAGIYRCRVEFKTGQARNSRVNLTVIGKFSIICIKYLPIIFFPKEFHIISFLCKLYNIYNF